MSRRVEEECDLLEAAAPDDDLPSQQAAIYDKYGLKIVASNEDEPRR